MMKRKVVTLSGSLRFWNEILSVACNLSADGIIVLAPFKDPRADDLSEEAKVMHDELHHQRIDMSDELHVINVNGYIGKSTRAEIIYAMRGDKPITFLNRPGLNTWLDILNDVSVDDIIQYITPTVGALVESIIDACMKHHALQNKAKFDFIAMSEEIRKYQTPLCNLIDAASQRLNTDLSEWPCIYINSSDKFESPMKMLIYSTPSELVDLLPELKSVLALASPTKSEFVFSKILLDDIDKESEE